MSDREDLLEEIRKVLPPGGTVKIDESDLDDLYESYVLSALIHAAEADGWNVVLHDMNEAVATEALFRRSPGNIYGSAGSQNFTHFLVSKTGVPPLEAHIGIKVTGKSDVEHECDVAVLPRQAARFCRQHRVHPRSARLIFAAECKFLGGRVPLGLGRGFLGLVTEVTSQYGQCHFVVNTTSTRVMKMLARQNKRRYEFVRPNAGGFETLQAACRDVFQSYFMRERS